MDFLTGFILGYFIKEIFTYIKRLATPVQKDWDKEWDWMSPLQEDDLP
tara:strand:+ start:2637 stop:2780 length:144 start_codon:yes stop_codon:yes gene_type:complete